jgi:phage-related protein
VRLKTAVYVLHVFKKKSKRGVETSKRDMDLIHSRLKWAETIEAERLKQKESEK